MKGSDQLPDIRSFHFLVLTKKEDDIIMSKNQINCNMHSITAPIYEFGDVVKHVFRFSSVTHTFVGNVISRICIEDMDGIGYSEYAIETIEILFYGVGITNRVEYLMEEKSILLNPIFS
ncbi:MAG: hypothetical protein F6K62_17850, partial [Sphaerospermopsis sp. SIO1G2]|nr:hypothetical protein [Sphaerospermopsis sp. SIO1G2]